MATQGNALIEHLKHIHDRLVEAKQIPDDLGTKPLIEEELVQKVRMETLESLIRNIRVLVLLENQYNREEPEVTEEKG